MSSSTNIVHLSAAEIEAHLGADGAVEWVPADALDAHAFLSCVDGRDPAAVLGTPGGDAGELLLFLAAIEEQTGTEFSQTAVARLVGAAIDRSGRFYMHTDHGALSALASALTQTAAFAFINGDVAQTEALLRQPGDAADSILPLLVQPANVGCGHLKLILLHPDQYRVRQALTEHFIAAIFGALWAGRPVHYLALVGGHGEGAVVNVVAGEGGVGLPAATPCRHNHTAEGGSQQMFVNHPEAVDFRRAGLAALLAEQVGGVEAGALLAAATELAGVQLTATLGHLAATLSVFTATVGPKGQVSVSG
jgi:hypothetical protein